MQVRCYHCHKPFALGKDALYLALEELHTQNLHHYNAYCPHCRRANRLSKDEIQRAAPEWKPGMNSPETDKSAE